MVISSETASLPPEPRITSRVAASTMDVSGGNLSFPVPKAWGNKRALRFATPNIKGGAVGGRDGWKHPNDIAVDVCDQIGRLTGRGCGTAGDGTKEDPPLEEVMDKFVVQVCETAGRMKLAGPYGPPSKDAGRKPEQPVEEAEPSPHAARPRNLRTRRRQGAGSPLGKDRYLGGSSPEKRTVRLRSEVTGRKDWPKFSITLTREEIDEDIYAVTGHRARGRPRKRPCVVQRNLDALLPGSWLSEINVASYRVRE